MMSKEPVSKFEKEVKEIDELLDRSVEHYRAAEPRPGLEGRVLAHLRATPAPSFRWNWQITAAAGAAALSVAALYFALRPAPALPIPGGTPMAQVAPSENPAPPELVESNTPTDSTKRAAGSVRLAREDPPKSVPTVTRTDTAVLRGSTFPTTRALSPQEVLLMRFLETAPRETQLSMVRAESISPIEFEKLSTPEIIIEPLPDFAIDDPSQGG